MARTQLTNLAGATQGNAAAEQLARTEAAIAEDASAREAYATSGLPPDWLKTGLVGLGAGAVFGGGAGLIAAGVQAILNKRERDGIAAYAAADAKAGGELIAGAERSLGRLEAAAETDQERLEVDILRDQFNQATILARHPNPQTAAQGYQQLMALPGLAQQEADEIQDERLAQAELARQEQQTFYARADDIRGDNIRESSRYIATVEGFDKMAELRQQGTVIGDTALIYALANMNDPGAIVTDGDISSLAATGSVGEQAMALYNQVLKGEGKLSPLQRDELWETAKGIMRSQMQAQLVRNDGAVGRARLARLPADYHSTVVVPVPDAMRDRVIATPPIDASDRPKVVTDESGELRDIQTEEPSVLSKIAIGLTQATGDILKDVGQQVGGNSVKMDTETGDRFLVDPSGGIIEQLEPATEFTNSAGDTIRRADGPNGPIYQNVTRQERMQGGSGAFSRRDIEERFGRRSVNQ